MSQARQDTDRRGGATLAWRAARLRAAGFEPALAHTIANDSAYDLHAILELIDRGCPPDLAARILAPDDNGLPPC